MPDTATTAPPTSSTDLPLFDDQRVHTSSTDPPDTDDRRVCRRCHRSLPISEFRRHKRGSDEREYSCRECHNLSERIRKKKAREVARSKQYDRLATQILRAKSLKRIEYVVGVMIQSLGGLERFVKEWSEHVRTASQQTPGSLRVLQAFRAIVRLLEYVDQKRAEEQANELTQTQDIARVLETKILHVIQRNPSLAVDAAKQLGWTVIPPTRSPK